MFFSKRAPRYCYELGGAQHQFEARYSTTCQPVTGLTLDNASSLTTDVIVALREGTLKRTATYHGDVCVWCGKVVNAQEKPT